MTPKKETRYSLDTFIQGAEQAKNPYISFQREIDKKGWVQITTEMGIVKVYTPELAVILISKELPARNMDNQTEATVNGLGYLKTYIEAYQKGEHFFETEFKVSPSTLYGENAEQYVRDIHINFFHIQHAGTNEGWGYVKKQYPFILTHKAVKDYGYYSGIVNKVEEQVKKHPRLFTTFDKCEHDLPPQPTETKTDRLKAELGKHGFFNLPKVSVLSEQNKQQLVELISKNKMPYGIAMFDFLGFIDHLDRENGTAYKANFILSRLFKPEAKDDTSAKHLRRSLVKPLQRYKAILHKETVQTDYEKLK
jgi:hypothetical protein